MYYMVIKGDKCYRKKQLRNGAREVAVLGQVSRVDLPEKATCEQRFEGSGTVSHPGIWGKTRERKQQAQR